MGDPGVGKTSIIKKFVFTPFKISCDHKRFSVTILVSVALSSVSSDMFIIASMTSKRRQ